jgi:predicted exporter
VKISISSAWRRSLLWLTAVLIAVLVLFARLELSFDLSAFFPKHTTLAHDVLIEQLRNGPGSRLLIIGISGPSTDESIESASELQQALSASPGFVSVLNGEFSEDTADVPEPIKDYYLLMRDIDFSESSLASALQSRLRDLAFGGGRTLLQLIARDPFLVTLDMLESLVPADMSGDPWIASNGSAVLMAETQATAIDIAAQSEAITTVRRAFAALPKAASQTLEITGVGAFSVELQETIRAEATARSIFASVALLLVLLVVFRSPRLLLLSALPLVTGFLAGLTLVTLLFDTVHGITLAFGFTLLGVAVDYPLHLFSHAHGGSGRSAIRRIWPTMRLGVLSTVIAYLALAFSNSEGLAQLGLFTVAGVIVASLATRTWLPFLLAEQEDASPKDARPASEPKLRYVMALVLLAAGLTGIYRSLDTGLWDDNLSSLSPVASERLATDRVLRSATATPDLRYQLVLYNKSLQALLRDSEAVDVHLARAVDAGLLEGWQSVSQILPSQQAQRRRQNAIPDAAILAGRLAAATEGTPFRADAFNAFLATAAASQSLPLLTPADIETTQMRSWLDAHLLQVGDEWIALVSLVQPQPRELAEQVAQWSIAASLVDLQASSVGLMRDYRNTALRTILVAALLIIALLWYARGQFRHTLWVGLTVTSALAVTIAVISSIHGSLTVIHMVALLLVLGLGLDYALFLSRVEPVDERRATDKGVLACAVSTTLAFVILAGSSIPVLKFLGLTVAAGSLISFLIAYSGSRLPRK